MNRTTLLAVILAAAALIRVAGGEEKKPVVLARPTPEQIVWHDMELQMFLCIDPCTWQNRERDNHSTPLEQINPIKLDTDQWAAAAEAMGAKQIVFVAKHHGGFCWWQTNTTDYGVKSIPWRGGKGDVVADLAASCRKRGLKLGIYLSPADDKIGAGGGGRCNNPRLQERYTNIYRQQLTELLSRYGEIGEVWFDGAIFIEVGDILRRYAPKAAIFQGPYTTMRWVGNENGIAPYPAWNSVSAEVARSGVGTAHHGDPNGAAWLPLECDAPIRGTWFWRSTPANAASLKSVDQLMEMYYRSVGRGAVLLLSNAPDTTGLIPKADFDRSAEFGAEIKRRFSVALAETRGNGPSRELDLGQPTFINHAIIIEDIGQGERVRRYIIEGFADGKWRTLCEGTAIGHKKIDHFPLVRVAKVRFRAVEAADVPQIRKFAVYLVAEAPTRLPGQAGGVKAETARIAWQWDPGIIKMDWKTVDIDLTPFCRDATVYRVEFRKTDGRHDVDIRSAVPLFKDSESPEFVRRVGSANAFDVTVPAVGISIKLRVMIRGRGGSDSRGQVSIRKMQP